MKKRKQGFSLKQAAHFLERGMITGVDAEWIRDQVKQNKDINHEDPVGLQHIVCTLLELKIPYKREHRFHDKRRFRFDLAILDRMIAIEYEGLFSNKSGHTTVTGYTKDTIKYNLAQSLGWTVLRYTAMNYKNFKTDILNLLDNEKDTILQEPKTG